MESLQIYEGAAIILEAAGKAKIIKICQSKLAENILKDPLKSVLAIMGESGNKKSDVKLGRLESDKKESLEKVVDQVKIKLGNEDS